MVLLEHSKKKILESCKEFDIFTGNVISWREVKKLAVLRRNEMNACLRLSLQSWLEMLSDADVMRLQSDSYVICVNPKSPVLVNEGSVTVAVKLFLSDYSAASAEQALNRIFRYLAKRDDYNSSIELATLDWLVISFPDVGPTGPDMDQMVQFWRQLESSQSEDLRKVRNLGVADLNVSQLKQLVNSVKRKPAMNQVNLASCCVMPAELIEFTQDNDIQLLTHNDPSPVLTAETYQSVLSQFVVAPEEAYKWRPNWIARYSVVARYRSVIESKGYLCNGRKHDSALPHSLPAP